MNKFSFLILLCLYAASAHANANFGIGQFNCTVATAQDTTTGASLRSLITKSNQGTACKGNITFLNPVTIAINTPLKITSSGLFLTGADFTDTSEELVSLGVAIDARNIQGLCALTVRSPQQSVVQALKFYVNDLNKAVCDEQGRSILNPQSAAFNVHYEGIEVCFSPEDCDGNGDDNGPDPVAETCMANQNGQMVEREVLGIDRDGDGIDFACDVNDSATVNTQLPNENIPDGNNPGVSGGCSLIR